MDERRNASIVVDRFYQGATGPSATCTPSLDLSCRGESCAYRSGGPGQTSSTSGHQQLAKQQEESARAIPRASADEIARTRHVLTEVSGVEESMLEGTCDAMRKG